jgi:hypothetical protein
MGIAPRPALAVRAGQGIARGPGGPVSGTGLPERAAIQRLRRTRFVPTCDA